MVAIMGWLQNFRPCGRSSSPLPEEASRSARPAASTVNTPGIGKAPGAAGANPKDEDLKGLVEAFIEQVLTKNFSELHAQKKPSHIVGALAGTRKIMDMDSIVAAMVRGQDHGSTAAFKAGELCMRESFFMAYLDHATLSLTEAERYFPELLRLCQGLSPHFGYATARLVVDPPSARCLPLHAEGDVFVATLWGEQNVTLVPPVTRGMPLTAPRPAPLLNCTVRSGDVVFLPAGLEYRTERTAEQTGPVLSVILTVRTTEHSFGNSLGKYINDVLRESLSDETNQFFRSAVTKQSLQDRYSADKSGASGGQQAELEARMKSATAELSSKLSAAALRSNFESRMDKLRQEQVEGAERMQKLMEKAPPAPNTVSTSSRIRVSKGVRCKCVPGESTAMFKRGTETLKLPIARTASYLISELTDGMPHLVDSLTCADPFERICVTQVLVGKECLEMCDDYEDDYASAYSGSFGSMGGGTFVGEGGGGGGGGGGGYGGGGSLGF